jgi:Domain of unknown function (DUF4280)
MAEKHQVVQGATCQCKHSESPQTDVLMVKTQKHDVVNDDGEEKLAATDKDIGQTFKKNTFGKCKLQPTSSGNLPCQAVVTAWSGFYKKLTYTNGGKALLEDSKAGCPIGGPDCISIKDHGQTAHVSKKSVESSKPEVLNQLLPGYDTVAKNNLHIIAD